MKKPLLVLILLFGFVMPGVSQVPVSIPIIKRNHSLYVDTTFETEGLKFETKGVLAFRDNIKIPMIITNSTNDFKIIYSKDISITDINNTSVVIREKKPMIIAPQSAKKFTVMAEASSYKADMVKITIKEIFSTGKAESVLSTKVFDLDITGPSTALAGSLEVSILKSVIKPDLTTRVNFRIKYTGDKFLGIYKSKAMLLTADKKAYINDVQKQKTVYYPAGKDAMGLVLEFQNPHPNISGSNCDRISFENVFVEYSSTSNRKAFEFKVVKKGETDEAPTEEKEKDGD